MIHQDARLSLSDIFGSTESWILVFLFGWLDTSPNIAKLCYLLIFSCRCEGVYNGVSPQIITNGDFTQAFAKAMRRPAVIPTPVFAFNALLGACLCACLLSMSVCLVACLSVCLSDYLIYLTVCISVCPSVRPSVCLTGCLTVCLSI